MITTNMRWEMNRITSKSKYVIKNVKIHTKQLFFPFSEHNKMVGNVKDFTIISKGYESAMFEMVKCLPKEILTLNCAKSSINKIISCYLSQQGLQLGNFRKTARYALPILQYKIQVNNKIYPNTDLKGRMDCNIGVLNNYNFMEELMNSFDLNMKNVCGIINTTNYSIGYQEGDKKNKKYIPGVGRGLISIDTRKIKDKTVFTGENNKMGCDIIRSVVCDTSIDLCIPVVINTLYEMIFCEYDYIVVLNKESKIQILN